MKDAPTWWEDARQELGDADPERAAVALCKRAIEFSACSLPSHYERGFALSLWEEQNAQVPLSFPARFRFSPELLLGDVVREYPALRGRFPRGFDANFMTGVFIPSERVPEVLAWVEQQVQRFEKLDQRRFKGLLHILRSAVERKLAYWEATDLTVPIMNIAAGDPALMTADYLGNEPTSPGPGVDVAPIDPPIARLNHGVVDHFLVESCRDTFRTRVWNLSSWPPRPAHVLSGFATRWTRSAHGAWLMLMETDREAEERTFRPRVFTDLACDAGTTAPALFDGKEWECSDVAFLGSKPLVFRERPSDLAMPGHVVEPPLVLIDGRWRAMAGLRSVPVHSSGSHGLASDPVTGAVRLNSGRTVVIWDGDGYEAVGDRFEPTFKMAAEENHVPWESLPLGSDGFFYLSNRRLHEIHRGQSPVAHVPKWTNIMHVCCGPAGSLLLAEGDNKDADVAKLYFPSDGTFVHIEPELFDDDEYEIHWSEAADRFVAVAMNRFVSIPTSIVLALPRYSASTGRRTKA